MVVDRILSIQTDNDINCISDYGFDISIYNFLTGIEDDIRYDGNLIKNHGAEIKDELKTYFSKNKDLYIYDNEYGYSNYGLFYDKELEQYVFGISVLNFPNAKILDLICDRCFEFFDLDIVKNKIHNLKFSSISFYEEKVIRTCSTNVVRSF